MISRGGRIQAALWTFEGERIRWLHGKKENLTTGENAFGKTITEVGSDFILKKAAAVELEQYMAVSKERSSEQEVS